MQTTIEIRVQEEDIDELGHVNYKKYIEFSEQGVFDWHAQIGLPFGEVIKRDLGFVLLKMDVTYQKEARLGDTLKIVTTPIKLGTKSYTIQQDIYSQKDEHLTEFTKTFVMFNTAERKGVPVLEEIVQAFHDTI